MGASSSGTASEKKPFLSEYVLGEQIGFGVHARVYSCAKKGRRDMNYAVKMIDNAIMPVDAAFQEVALMHQLVHENLAKVHASFDEKHFFCIVMDKFEGGDLLGGMQVHWKTKGQIPVDKVQHIVRGMAAAIDYLHQHLCMHRDICGENFLLDRKDIVDPECKVSLADFGHTVKLSSRSERLKAVCGRKHFWSPERYSENYSLAADIWAFGVLLYGLCSGRFPFKHEQEVREKQIRVARTVPEAFAKLVSEGLLVRTEDERLDARSIIHHDYFGPTIVISLSHEHGLIVATYLSGLEAFRLEAASSPEPAKVLQERFSEALHVQPCNVRLLMQGRLLEESELCVDLCTITLMVRSSGGSPLST